MSDCRSGLLNAAIKAGTACEYVSKACTEYEFVNFMHYKYCILNANTGINQILFIATMVRISNVASASADRLLHARQRGRNISYTCAHAHL